MSQEFRVFISSTFRDLHNERDHLVKKVFPEIRAKCRERGVTFTEVDLRWGITDDDVTSGRVIRACLEEIDRTAPYFIGITGDRYGYVPSETDFQSDPELTRQFPVVAGAVTEGASITDLEFRYGVIEARKHRTVAPRAFFYFKQRDRTQLVENISDDLTKLAALEDRVRELEFPTYQYLTPEELGELVKADMYAVLDRDFAMSRPPTPLEAERTKHLAFAASRRHAYLANQAYIATLDAFATSKELPLVISAESGAGKSSLLAYWAEKYRTEHPEAHVIEHYVGVGVGSTDHLTIMRHVMGEIKERFERSEEVPTDAREIERQFTNWLGFTGESPIVIVIDAVNQLSGAAAQLGWLPTSWPSNIRLILSTTSTEMSEGLSTRGWSILCIAPLEEQERRTIISQFLRSYGKALAQREIDRIAVDNKSAHPLFLRTLLEELRIYGTHETLHERVDRCLRTTTTDDLFQIVLERMENDFGERQVRDVLSLLWTSRSGLSAGELVEIAGLSRLDISLITLSLDYHLLQRDGLLGFFHDYLRRAVETRYINVETVQGRCQRSIAGHFFVNVLSESERVKNEADLTNIPLRSAREASYQLYTLGDDERLATLLSEIPVFMVLKVDQVELLEMWHKMETRGRVPSEYYLASLDRLRAHAPELLPDALLALNGFFHVRGEYHLTEGLLKELVAHREEQGEKTELLRALGALAKHYERRTMLDAAAPLFRSVLDRAGDDTDFEIKATAMRGLALIYTQLSKYAEALEIYEYLLPIYEARGDKAGIAQVQMDFGLVYWYRVELEKAMSCYQKGLEYYRATSNKAAIGTVIGKIGNVYSLMGKPEEAIKCHEQLLEISEALGDKLSILASVSNIAHAIALIGDYDKALQYNRRQLKLAEEIGHSQGIVIALNSMATIASSRGQNDEALKLFERAVKLARETSFKFALVRMLYNFSRLKKHRKEYDEAYALAEEMVGLSLEVNAKDSYVNAHTMMASILDEQGKRQEARSMLMAAFQEAQQEGIPEHIAELHTRLWAFDQTGEEAENHRKTALELYSQVQQTKGNLKWLRERIALLKGEIQFDRAIVEEVAT